MSTSEYTLVGGKQTEGTWSHTGKLVVSSRLANGSVVTVTLPDDLQALLARVDALEALATRTAAAQTP